MKLGKLNEAREVLTKFGELEVGLMCAFESIDPKVSCRVVSRAYLFSQGQPCVLGMWSSNSQSSFVPLAVSQLLHSSPMRWGLGAR